MNYLSVCSGVEAATVAWHDMGWNPVGFSEIEKFPSQVLANHYPNVTNFGDMTKYKEWNINEPVNLLVGGTPCQSFSVAGLRKGLQDPRGNLALVYLGIADHFKPKWIVWENVPGVLSSNGGRDFGSFLGALAELGYGFAYRVLDAQNFGVAQRRRRVFVVGCLGDWRGASSVLFESESLRGDTKASKNEGKDLANCLTKSPSSYSSYNPARSEGNAVVVYETHPADSRVKEMGEVCQTVTSRWGTGGGNVPIAIQGNLIGRDAGGPNGIGVSEENTMYTLTKADVHGVSNNMRVRRLTPIECERLQGFPDNYTKIFEKTPDSHRYKAMGNSMAVPVMRWIGERINAS
jgi:DNA (cytosine-5)-methyltransferase 1